MQRFKQFLFTNRSAKQTVAKNTFWLFVGELGSKLLKLGIFGYGARMLGTNEWGVFSYGLALIGVFSIFSDIGINAVLQREVARKTGVVDSYLSAAFFLKATLSLISALVLYTVSFFVHSNAIAIIIPLISVLLFIDSIREFGYAVNRAHEQMETEALIKLCTNALIAGIAFLLIRHTPNASALLQAYIYAGIVGLIFLYFTMRPYIKALRLQNDHVLLRTIMREAWPIGIVAMFGTILSSIDTLLLGWFTDSGQVGLYAAAQKPVQLVWLIPGLLATALLPLLSRNAHTHDETFVKALGRTVTATLALMVPVIFVTIVGAKYIITVLFGNGYIQAIPLLQIISIGTLVTIPSIFLSNALLAYGKQKLTLRFIAIGAVSNVILSLILIPHYHMYGAALSYTLSQLISNVYMVIVCRTIPALRFTLSIRHLKEDILSIIRH